MNPFEGYALCVLFEKNESSSGHDRYTLVLISEEESVAKNIPAIVRDYLKMTNNTDTVVDGNSLGQMQFELFCVSCTETVTLGFSVKKRVTFSGRQTWFLVMTSDPDLDLNDEGYVLALAERGVMNTRKRAAQGSGVWGMCVRPNSSYPFVFRSFRASDLASEVLK